MSTRREFLKQTAAAGVVVTTSVQVAQPAEDVSSGTQEPMQTNRAAPKSGVRIKWVIRREETVQRCGGHGDNWHMSWAADDRQYVSLCDGAGFLEPFRSLYNSRMLAISDGPRDARFHDLPGYPMLGVPTQGAMDARYYGFGTLALDGRLYQFMSTFNRASRPDDAAKPDFNDLLRFNGAKLVYSPDNGRTWHNQDGSTPVVWEPWDRRSRNTLVFFEEDQEAFSLLTVLQMGKNYEHNHDGYVYVYAPNGNTEGTMNELVMFRVPKTQILSRSAYEYFAGFRANGAAQWTPDITARVVVHTFLSGWVNKLAHPYAWQPSVVYNSPLGLYLMANWGMGCARDGMWFAKPSYLGFWIAQNPWGPWTQIHEETAWMPERDAAALAYQPQIAPKWIAADGKSFWLVWTDYQAQDKDAWRGFYKAFTEKYFRNQIADGDWGQYVAMSRKCRPYYAFNIQRIDLIVA